MHGSVVAVTGSVGKTGTKEMLRLALSELGADARAGRLVQQSLGRAADARAHAGGDALRRLRDRHEPCRRDPAADAAGAAARRDRHHGRAGASRLSSTSEAAIAEAKAEIFEGLEPGGAAVLNRDNRWFDLLADARARARRAHRLLRRASRPPTCGSSAWRCSEDASSVQARLFGEPVTYRLGAPGRHLVQNSLAVLAAAHALGADLARVAAGARPASARRRGRGERMPLAHPSGPFTLIDESYNANPASMRAALALLGQANPAGARPPDRRPRRHAGARRGGAGAARGAGAGASSSRGADLVFLAGPLMAGSVAGLAGRAPGRLCGERGGARTNSARGIGPAT